MPQHGCMSRLPTVLGTDDLPLAELCAARIDGELMPIEDGWVPVDEPDLPALRAAVVALRAPRALVIERRSAAWVHGALSAPPKLAQFCVPRSARVAVFAARRLVVREVAIAEADIVEYPRARCTSLGRTGFDLLREPIDDDELDQLVSALCAMHPWLATELRDRLSDAVRMPHRSLARERLRRVEDAVAAGRPLHAAQPSLTR